MKGHQKTQRGSQHRSLAHAFARAVASTGMMASALFTVGVAVAATSAGAASSTTLAGSPYNGTDGVLDTYGTITHQTDPANSNTDNIFGSAPAAKEQQTCPTETTGPVDSKSDLTDFWIGDSGSPGQDTYLYLAWKRVATNGDANIDFELNQSTHTACVGPTPNNQRTGGDLLIQYNFASTTGAITIDVYDWVTSGTNSTCDIGSITTYGGCWKNDPLASGSYEASVGSNNSFGEAVINLQTSNIFPTGVCENLASAFVKSRASTSPTADLKDYVSPKGVTVDNCSPTTTQTTPSDKTPTLGEPVTDSVIVTGNTTQGAPQGTVTFYVCANTTQGCDPASGTKLLGAGNPATLVTNKGTDTSSATSPSYIPPAPGDYCFAGVYTPTPGTAIYSGSNDETTRECFHVGPAASTSKTTVSGGPLTLGAAGTLSDSVTVTGNTTGGSPTGTVDFYVCRTSPSTTLTPGPCDPATSTAGGSNVSLTKSGGDTSAATSTSYSPTSAGTWCFAAVYSGDTNYQGSSDNTSASNQDNAECALVSKASSSISTVVFDNATKAKWDGTETTNSVAYDTSSIKGVNNVTPTGTVDYYLYGPGDGSCAATPPTLFSTVTVNADGTVPSSADMSPLAAGNYSFKAVYSGDTNYSGSTGECEPFAVGLGATSTATTVNDNATKATWSGNETVGAEAFDTASVTSAAGTPTGSVTFYYFTDGTCLTPISDQTAALVNGAASSDPTAALRAGDYSYQAVYSGDTNYAGSTGPCEPFSVKKTDSSTDTTVFDASTSKAWDKTETTGAAAYDTSTVTGVTGFAPSGKLTYTFFTDGTCTTSSYTDTVDLLSNGSVPNSTSTAPLAAGSYSFRAVYAGDTNYNGSTGPCEDFAVAQAASSITTTVYDPTIKGPWSGTETLGATAYDTSSLAGGVTGFDPTGTVIYTLYPNKSCAAPSTPLNSTEATSTVKLTAGSVPDSDPTDALAAGDYSFQAVYSGDNNYAGSTGSCEPFSVAPATTAISTVVDDAASSQPWTGAETTGASAFDTASLASVTGFTPTGTVTYRFFSNGSCTNPAQQPDPFSTVTLSAGAVPKSDPTGALATGSYSFQATYAGDSNYQGSTGACEPFTVAAVAATPSPASVTAQKTSVPADGSVVTVGSTVVYTITLTNSGQVAATNVTVTDTVPAGTSFVSADQGGNQANGTVTWSGLNVPAGGTTAVSFTVTVNTDDTDGQTIPNVARFTDVNTPGCSGDPCSTNTVTVTVHTAQLAPASSPTTSTTSTTSTTVAPTTTTTAASVAPATVTPPATNAPKTTLAFTGADMLRTLGGGFLLTTAGGVLTVISRRRRRGN